MNGPFVLFSKPVPWLVLWSWAKSQGHFVRTTDPTGINQPLWSLLILRSLTCSHTQFARCSDVVVSCFSIPVRCVQQVVAFFRIYCSVVAWHRFIGSHIPRTPSYRRGREQACGLPVQFCWKESKKKFCHIHHLWYPCRVPTRPGKTGILGLTLEKSIDWIPNSDPGKVKNSVIRGRKICILEICSSTPWNFVSNSCVNSVLWSFTMEDFLQFWLLPLSPWMRIGVQTMNTTTVWSFFQVRTKFPKPWRARTTVLFSHCAWWRTETFCPAAARIGASSSGPTLTRRPHWQQRYIFFLNCLNSRAVLADSTTLRKLLIEEQRRRNPHWTRRRERNKWNLLLWMGMSHTGHKQHQRNCPQFSCSRPVSIGPKS